jgi:hypothetical protein
MTDLCLDDLQPGLVLLRQVLDKKGNVLLGKGVQLTLRHLSLLRAHGVSRVAAAPPGTESTPAAVLSAEEASMLVEQQFRNTDPAHPLIDELKRICRQRRQTGAPGGSA